jgi:hypothetical protein
MWTMSGVDIALIISVLTTAPIQTTSCAASTATISLAGNSAPDEKRGSKNEGYSNDAAGIPALAKMRTAK